MWLRVFCTKFLNFMQSCPNIAGTKKKAESLHNDIIECGTTKSVYCKFCKCKYTIFLCSFRNKRIETCLYRVGGYLPPFVLFADVHTSLHKVLSVSHIPTHMFSSSLDWN